MGIDTQLIDDGTYFVVEVDGALAGCGGWSRRATLYGGNAAPGRNSTRLDPSVDPARVRAMYTAPAFARRGVGRLILSLCRGCGSRGLHASRAHVHAVRPAAVRRVRIPSGRAARGRYRRRASAARPDGEARRGGVPSSALSGGKRAQDGAEERVPPGRLRERAGTGHQRRMPGVPRRGWKRSTRPRAGRAPGARRAPSRAQGRADRRRVVGAPRGTPDEQHAVGHVESGSREPQRRPPVTAFPRIATSE